MDKPRKTEPVNNREKRGNILLVCRITAAAALMILAYTAHMPKASVICVLIAAALVGSANTLFAILDAVMNRDWFSPCIVVFVSAAAVFCTGCFKEAVLFIVFYEGCSGAFDYAVKRTMRSAADLAEPDDKLSAEAMRAAVSHPDALGSSLRDSVSPYFDIFSKAALAVGFLFAVFVPLFTEMTYIMSIRRGAMLIAASVSASALISLAMCSSYAIAMSAGYGVFVKDSSVLEKASRLKRVIFDKAGVFSDGVPKLSSVWSPVLDKDAFLQLAAYIACRSEQKIASRILEAYGGEVDSRFAQDFSEIPGCVMEIKAKGHPMYLAVKEVVEARGIEIPESELRGGYVLYMVLGDKLAGSLTFRDNISPVAESVVSDFAKLGGVKSTMLTEDCRDISERLAQSLKIDDLYYECDTDKKLDVISRIRSELLEDETLMFVTAEDMSEHSEADIDARYGMSTDSSDIFMSDIGLFGLPVIYSAAKRAKKIEKQNLLAAIAVKLLLIVLALTGSATMWFIILLDFAVSIGCVLNVTRIPETPKPEGSEEE